jgi:hypothetical protein
MALYKAIEISPRRLAVALRAQLVPDTFEYTLDWIAGKKLDLSGFDTRCRYEMRRAAAQPRGVLRHLRPLWSDFVGDRFWPGADRGRTLPNGGSPLEADVPMKMQVSLRERPLLANLVSPRTAAP